MELPANSIGSGNTAALHKAANDLHSLVGREKLDIPIPDGIVPTALQDFLFALGCTVRSVTLIVTACLMTQLNIISALTRTRKMRVGEFWRQLGLASDDKAAVQHAAPHPCPLCHTQATVFFHIQLATGPESTVLLQNLLQARHDAIEKVWPGQGLDAAQKCDTKTIERDGAHLCFGCAIKTIPDLMDKPTCPQPAPPTTVPDNRPDLLPSDTHSTSSPPDATRPDTILPTQVMGPRQRNCPQWFQPQASETIDDSLKSPRDHRPANDPNSSALSLKARILCEMRVVAGTRDSERLLLPSDHCLVPRLNMWLKQYGYLTGQQVWISQLASPLHLGSLMQTVQDPCHDPISHFLPEYGELTKLHGSVVEVEFSENRRRFDLTMKSVIGTPITTLCTITNV